MKFFDWLIASQETKLSYRERERACKTCDVLQLELARAHALNGKLLDRVMEPQHIQPKYEPVNKVMGTQEFNRVPPTSIRTWEATRAALEAKDAEEFARKQALAKQAEIDKLAKANSVDELEQALEIKDA